MFSSIGVLAVNANHNSMNPENPLHRVAIISSEMESLRQLIEKANHTLSDTKYLTDLIDRMENDLQLLNLKLKNLK